MTDHLPGCPCPSCTEVRAANDTRPPNPVNAQALLDIIPVLRELDDQGRFDMRLWAEGAVNPNAADYTECGTQFCLAGAKAAVDGWRPQYAVQKVYNEKLNEYVKTGKLMATGLFLRPEHRHITNTQAPEARCAVNIAAEAFALDRGQVEFLFYGTWISRVTDLVRRIQWLIDGEHWSTYPQELIELELAHGGEDYEKRQEARRRAFETAAAK